MATSVGQYANGGLSRKSPIPDREVSLTEENALVLIAVDIGGKNTQE